MGVSGPDLPWMWFRSLPVPERSLVSATGRYRLGSRPNRCGVSQDSPSSREGLPGDSPVPRLRPILAEAFALAPEGAESVVGGDYRQSALTPSGWRNCNLRTQFERLVKRAGLKPWPRLFHNLWASRETELAKEYPIHVVTAWLGNTPRIALKHYLQLTAADFEKANQSGAESGAVSVTKAVQNAVQPTCASVRQGRQETTQPLEKSRGWAKCGEPRRDAAKTISGGQDSNRIL